MSDDAILTFIPWVRRGVGRALAQGADVDGVPQSGGGEPEVTPATEGAFTVRFQESTAADGSAISNMVAPVCADRQCQAIFLTDATAMSMRVISFLGATFPNGTQRPQVAFRLP